VHPVTHVSIDLEPDLRQLRIFKYRDTVRIGDLNRSPVSDAIACALCIDDIVEKDGFQSFRTQATTEPELSTRLLSLAGKLGSPIAGRGGRLLEPIVPRDEQSAQSRSLSKLHGLSTLPMHIDTAHYLRPARLLIIGCVKPGLSKTTTRLLDTRKLEFTSDELALLISAPMLVRSGKRSFYSTILGRDRSYFRYDPGCVEPVDKRGEEALAIMGLAISRSKVEDYEWYSGDILVIDNWRMFHGRTQAATDGRFLLRISVE